jgi:hypothetical protein
MVLFSNDEFFAFYQISCLSGYQKYHFFSLFTSFGKVRVSESAERMAMKNDITFGVELKSFKQF